MENATSTHRIVTYSDATPIGEIEMTAEQWTRYLRIADASTGAIALSDIPGHAEYSIVMPPETTVYLED